MSTIEENLPIVLGYVIETDNMSFKNVNSSPKNN